MATLISNVLAFLLLAAVIVSGLPASDESKISPDTDKENSTLLLDLLPPIEEDSNEKNVTLFIINLYAIRNHSGEGSEEMLDNNVIQKMPDIIGPLATLFLVVEEDGDEEPVDLDSMAKFMEEQGFKIDKMKESGETSVLKTEIPDKDINDVKEMLESSGENSSSEKMSKSKKYRVRRMACHKCHGGGGRGKGGGGGGQYGVIPVYVVPVAVQQQPQYHPPPQQYHPPPQQYHPQPVCDPCQGRGGGGRGGGGNAYAQASAQASAGGW